MPRALAFPGSSVYIHFICRRVVTRSAQSAHGVEMHRCTPSLPRFFFQPTSKHRVFPRVSLSREFFFAMLRYLATRVTCELSVVCICLSHGENCKIKKLHFPIIFLNALNRNDITFAWLLIVRLRIYWRTAPSKFDRAPEKRIMRQTHKAIVKSHYNESHRIHRAIVSSRIKYIIVLFLLAIDRRWIQIITFIITGFHHGDCIGYIGYIAHTFNNRRTQHEEDTDPGGERRHLATAARLHAHHKKKHCWRASWQSTSS